ncbi:MAG: hypothetical protein VZS44_04615 [Bacilli bacterium]|nr:hypothetical protein [Bacilli bacterium]
MKKHRIIYIAIIVIVLILSVLGSTYAYLTAKTESASNTIKAASTSYSLSMEISPLYNDFRIIPMDDTDVIKALKNKCKDKYNRGACSAYEINVNGYDDSLQTLTGKMDIELINIMNLSYMMFEEKEEIESEETCINIDENNNSRIYCKTIDATPVLEGEDLSLGVYDVTNTTDKNFMLVVWLSNINGSQNDYDIGDYNAAITFAMGNGGSITGNIAASIGKEEELQSQSGE